MQDHLARSQTLSMHIIAQCENMNFFRRSKASDKAEDVAVAASVQLILMR